MLEILGQIAFYLSLTVIFILAVIAVFLVVYLIVLLPASIFLGKIYEKLGIAPEFWTIVLSVVIASLATYNAAVAPAVCPVALPIGAPPFSDHPFGYLRDGCVPLYWQEPLSLLSLPF